MMLHAYHTWRHAIPLTSLLPHFQNLHLNFRSKCSFESWKWDRRRLILGMSGDGRGRTKNKGRTASRRKTNSKLHITHQWSMRRLQRERQGANEADRWPVPTFCLLVLLKLNYSHRFALPLWFAPFFKLPPSKLAFFLICQDVDRFSEDGCKIFSPPTGMK